MDPVSAVGLGHCIIQLIDATAKAVSYLNDVRNAPKDRATLAQEVSSLLALLTSLRYKVEGSNTIDPWFTGVRFLGRHGGPLEQFKAAIAALLKKLRPGKGLKEFGKALVWTLDKEEISGILSKIERLKTLIGVALQEDHL
jgi:hypothetical protein